MPAPKVTIPVKGKTKKEIFSEMETFRENDVPWQDGRAFSLVFYPGEEVNPTAFPSLRKMETEVVSMAAGLMKGDDQVVGNMTSGGTESILLAVKTAREYFTTKHPDIQEPEMVLPVTAHPAFEKAAYYFNVKPIHIPVQEDKRADPVKMQEAITDNTILMVGSAPAYPHGVIDPLSELGKIARDNDLLLHVDACVGGFMLPFVEKAGYELPPFGFDVPGVTSISMDAHKYGYSAKGASVILYRHPGIRRSQFFVYTDWPGGIYASPTISGTKPGGSIAATWAVLNYLGEKGYTRIAKQVMRTTKRFQKGINAIDGVYVIGDPDMSIMGLTSDQYDIFAIGDEMSKKGWHMDRQQFPDSLHLTISRPHKKMVNKFLADLQEAVAKAKKLNWTNLSSRLTVKMVQGFSRVLPEKIFSKLMNNAQKLGGANISGRSAALYGITGSIPNRGGIKEMVVKMMDEMMRVEDKKK
ncbi:MAG: aspartate aminotransferase family protein [Bacteroidetes bacterium SW_11_45_7]|nr:MAG: aspartate aminotransferase family protein [Bacteroidetes bacterium SW_11_45_7]